MKRLHTNYVVLQDPHGVFHARVVVNVVVVGVVVLVHAPFVQVEYVSCVTLELENLSFGFLKNFTRL